MQNGEECHYTCGDSVGSHAGRFEMVYVGGRGHEEVACYRRAILACRAQTFGMSGSVFARLPKCFICFHSTSLRLWSMRSFLVCM